MKSRSTLFLAGTVLLLTITGANTVIAQQYKLKQTTNMMGMKSESTIYVKGMRKRTEAGAMIGMPAPPVTIEQCDLQRTIKLNDKKKLYFIEPFGKETDEVIEEDTKPAVKPKPAVTTTKKGGIITNWYSITDTGERKKMYGFTARHVWTYQKMKPSPDACSMKDSFIIKTDGWYIDLPQFNCPVRYRPSRTATPQEQQKPDCQDKFVTRRRGKGKLGFPLVETTTYIMGNGTSGMNEFKSDIETMELSTLKLDSMLFEIPPGYTETMNEQDLQDKFDMNEMINQYKNNDKGNEEGKMPADETKKPGVVRIGVYLPKAEEQLQGAVLQQQLSDALTGKNIEAMPVATEEEARKYNCDYTLATDITRMKPASKVGGLLKAIKNADPNAASSYNIEGGMTLVKLADGSTLMQPKLDGKYEGKPDDAARKMLEQGARQILKGLK